ncbi:MAG TPA: hypothetical protein VL981_09560 [Candidatus Methylacidiphilales bacterium]|nr:hypothetical protein [Candidatus Methylacidiphilales bacterium]
MGTLESIFSKPGSSLESKEQIEMIRSWIRPHLGVDVETVIIVRQVDCHNPSCPGFETVVAILEDRRTRRIKILKPISDVQEIDIINTIECGKISTVTYFPRKD